MLEYISLKLLTIVTKNGLPIKGIPAVPLSSSFIHYHHHNIPKTLTNERLLYITEEKPLKNIVPKHFPYISIEWCHCDSKKGCYGIAHVIENDSRFSSDFCLDVVAGILRKVIVVVVAA